MTINELANQLLIKHNSAVGLVDRLEEEGLVTRKTALDDRRKVNIRLTAKGARIFRKLATEHRLELQRFGPDLSRFLAYFSQPPGEVAPPPISGNDHPHFCTAGEGHQHGSRRDERRLSPVNDYCLS